MQRIRVQQDDYRFCFGFPIKLSYPVLVPFNLRKFSVEVPENDFAEGPFFVDSVLETAAESVKLEMHKR